MAARTSWKIEPVVLADAPAMARNNLSAFWPDPGWRLSWPSVTLDFLIEQHTKQVPEDLLYNQEVLRHLKAVDPETGKLVGYARFALPLTHTRTADGKAIWPEAQTADVSAEERKRIEDISASASWERLETGLDREPQAIQKRILSEGTYISEYNRWGHRRTPWATGQADLAD